MIYRLFTTTEDRLFDDFMVLIDHIESAYGWLRAEFCNGQYNLYNEQDEKIGYYKIVL